MRAANQAEATMAAERRGLLARHLIISAIATARIRSWFQRPDHGLHEKLHHGKVLASPRIIRCTFGLFQTKIRATASLGRRLPQAAERTKGCP